MPPEFSYQQRKKLRADSRYYICDDPLLFRRGVDLIIRKCVPDGEQSKILQECHASPYGEQSQVYILPTPAEKLKPAAPAPKGKSNPSLQAMQKFKRLVASVHKFATTSKAQAAAYTAWHSGWFGCRFGFGASEPRHF